MRGYRTYNTYKPQISNKDRIFSGLSCLTYGLVGFVWIIVAHMRRESLSSFARFHIFQSIFIFIGIYVIGLILNILLGFIQLTPFLGPIAANIIYFANGYPLILGMSLTGFLIQGLAVYMAVFAFLGKYAEVPGISDTIRRMI